jgi:Spy/CpxP family protein refolding chaperone
MRFKTLTLAAAAATLAVAPVAAHAAPVAPASAPVAGEMEMGGGSDGLIAILAAAILATFIYFSVDGDGDNDPISA